MPHRAARRDPRSKEARSFSLFMFLTNAPFLHPFLQNNLQDFGYTHNVLTTQADATGVKNGGKREEEKKRIRKK
jgi:hypothetical protein